MDTKQLDIVKEVLNTTFVDPPVARLDKRFKWIEVDAWTIGEQEMEVQSIRGPMEVMGYALTVAVPYFGSDIEPPGTDIQEIATSRLFPDIVRILAAEYAKHRAEVVFDNLSTEAMVAELAVEHGE
jgi:hypothetical protein